MLASPIAATADYEDCVEGCAEGTYIPCYNACQNEPSSQVAICEANCYTQVEPCYIDCETTYGK